MRSNRVAEIGPLERELDRLGPERHHDGDYHDLTNLVLLSRLKHDVVQMTANFVDLMVIDRDTAAYLFTIFPNLRWSVIGCVLGCLVVLALGAAYVVLGTAAVRSPALVDVEPRERC